MKVLLTAVTAALVLASTASSASHFTLRPVAKTGNTVTFSWARQPGADGYVFLRNGVPVARTLSPSTTTATFWKGARYSVAVLHRARGGRFTKGSSAVFVTPRSHVRPTRSKGRLVFVPAPSPRFALHVVARTPKTVTFAWKPQPGAGGYRFVRNGAVVARTMNRSVNTATFWKGSRYAVDVLGGATAGVAMPFRRAVAFLPARNAQQAGLVFRPAPRIDFRLRVVAQTKRTITFGWKRQPVADGYRFLRNGVAVAQTFDRRTRTATFWKGSRYEVQVLRIAPGKRVTAVMRALAFRTLTSTGSAASGKKAGSDTGGAGSAASSSPAPGAPKAAQPPARSDEPSSQAPKPPAEAPKPPAQQPQPTRPAPSPAPSPSPAPAPAPSPSPPSVGPGGVVSLSGSYSPSAFFQAVAVAPPGPVTVRGSFTITGDINIDRPNLRIEGATIQGSVDFNKGGSGSALVSSSASHVGIWSADNVLLEGDTFDGQGRVKDGITMWDQPSGDPPSGWVFRNNTFQNFYIGEGSDVHSQAIYVGYSTDGVIEGNTFTNNGTTSHIFFTWFGGVSDPGSSWPRDICVRGNSFNNTHGAYYDVNFRAEIPSSAHIVIQRDASSTSPQFYGSC